VSKIVKSKRIPATGNIALHSKILRKNAETAELFQIFLKMKSHFYGKTDYVLDFSDTP